MIDQQIVTGTLTDSRTIVLDEAIAPVHGRVRLIVEPIEPSRPAAPLRDFLEALRKRQAARGHVSRSREEIDRVLREDRGSWND